MIDKSHRPLSQHPNAHTDSELKWIQDYHRRNPHISFASSMENLEQTRAYARHPGSLYRVFRRLGYSSAAPPLKETRKQTL